MEERQSVKVLLLNDLNELLLIRVEDPKTTTIAGKYHGPFWCLVGGGIEPGETVEQAALREIHEEVGIEKEDIELGPVVWCASFDFIRRGVPSHLEEHFVGVPTHMEECFIVAKTKRKKVTPEGLTPCEEEVIKEMAWLSLEKIKQLSEKVYPVSLVEHMPDILAGKYPAEPIKIKAC